MSTNARMVVASVLLGLVLLLGLASVTELDIRFGITTGFVITTGSAGEIH